MNKYISAILLGVGVCLSSCEDDVDAPYVIHVSNEKRNDVVVLPFSESFSSSLGGFVSELASGSGEWDIDHAAATASGYNSSTKVTTEGSYYLLSPKIYVESTCHLKYDYILRYNQGNDNQRVLISNNYKGNAQTADWEILNEWHVEGTDYNTFYDADINIPEKYVGDTVRIAFYYNCPSSGSTWEVKNFSMLLGTAGRSSVERVPYGIQREISEGTYLISVGIDGTYKMATNISTSKEYGWLYTTDSKMSSGVLYSVGTTCDWTFKAVEGGYTIQDSYGRYIYLDGTYDSFQVSATMPTSAHVWSVSIDEYGRATIKNVSKKKVIQYSSSFVSFGAYSSMSYVLPCLCKKEAEPAEVRRIALEVDFKLGLGNWTEMTSNELSKIESVWISSASDGAVADAFDEGLSEISSMLVSPQIDMSEMKEATLTIVHKQQYFDSQDDINNSLTVLVSVDGTSWKPLAISDYPEYNMQGDKTSAVATADMSEYAGKTVRIAFKTTSGTGVWMIESATIK